jgi:hypothetical protein
LQNISESARGIFLVASADAGEALSKPREGKSKSQGRKFKEKGSEIQIFFFRRSRLFNGLSYKSKNNRPAQRASASRSQDGDPRRPTDRHNSMSSDYHKQIPPFFLFRWRRGVGTAGRWSGNVKRG